MIKFIHTAVPIYPTYSPELLESIPKSTILFTSPDLEGAINTYGGVNLSKEYGVAQRYALYKMYAPPWMCKAFGEDYAGKMLDFGAIIHVCLDDVEYDNFKIDQDVSIAVDNTYADVFNLFYNLTKAHPESDYTGLEVLNMLEGCLRGGMAIDTTVERLYEDAREDIVTGIGAMEREEFYPPMQGERIEEVVPLVTQDRNTTLTGVDNVIALLIERLEPIPLDHWLSYIKSIKDEVVEWLADMLEDSLAQTIYGDTVDDGKIIQVDIVDQHNKIETAWSNSEYSGTCHNKYYHGTTLACAKEILKYFGSDGWDMDMYNTFVKEVEDSTLPRLNGDDSQNGQMLLDIVGHDDGMPWMPSDEDRRAEADKWLDSINMAYWDSMYLTSENPEHVDHLMEMKAGLLNRYPDQAYYIIGTFDPGYATTEWLIMMLPYISSAVLKYVYLTLGSEMDEVIEYVLYSYEDLHKDFLLMVLRTTTDTSLIQQITEALDI